jgi:penicillin amidase
VKRFIVRLAWAALILIVAGISLVWVLLEKSLPQIDGEIAASHLTADATIARDAAGIPVITAENRRDLAYATGYVHAQDRFFQMDLSRRNAAGELSELFGVLALPRDRQNRFHRFRTRARAAFKNVLAADAEIISAYADGVNAGLADLGAKPFEYFLLGTEPRMWVEEDTILVVYSMFMDLNDERARRDVRRGLVQQVLPQQVYDWLYQHGTKWDAPLMGEPRETVSMPAAAEFDVSAMAPMAGIRTLPANADAILPGSNNWAVAGKLTASGRAIVANDMHLGITVPNVFYRARLRVTGPQAIDLNGLTIPGAPILVAGSNGKVAWGNTNSYGDWSDAVIIKAGSEPDSYLTPLGERKFSEYRETILVKDSEPEEFIVKETIWGPLLDDNADPDRMLAVSWIAHHAEAVNINHLELETVTSVAAALQVANRIGMPPQNFVVGDASGNIGWTIAGKIPLRSDYDAWLPADWSETDGWTGWLGPDDYPRVINPESGRIWTANARVADGEALHKIGDGGYDFGARARQIRDSLFAQEQFEPLDMLAVQLDDRAIFLSDWRDILLRTLNDEAIAGNSARQEYRDLVENWSAHASVQSVGYRLVRAFRLEVRNRVFSMLMQPVRERFGEDIALRISNQFEGPLQDMLGQQPAHLLSAEYESWNDLLLQAVDTDLQYFADNYDDGLDQRTWGERNTARVRHPMSNALPIISRWLNMPADQLPGDSNLPRAQGPSFGASERFAVSPGDESRGYLNMPAGQSGHPLSDFYRKGHADWVAGRPSSFQPGEARYTLTLEATSTP